MLISITKLYSFLSSDSCANICIFRSLRIQIGISKPKVSLENKRTKYLCKRDTKEKTHVSAAKTWLLDKNSQFMSTSMAKHWHLSTSETLPSEFIKLIWSLSTFYDTSMWYGKRMSIHALANFNFSIKNPAVNGSCGQKMLCVRSLPKFPLIDFGEFSQPINILPMATFFFHCYLLTRIDRKTTAFCFDSLVLGVQCLFRTGTWCRVHSNGTCLYG